MKKLKLILSLLIIINTAIGFSQEEPQWMMKFYFEDATGQKDTVYYGIDEKASYQTSIIDSVFYDYEKKVSFDPSKFNVHLPNIFSIPPNADSIRKASITSFQYRGFWTQFGFIGTGEFPITMKWENEMLYSENLPDTFSEIQGRPRARLDIYPEGALGCTPHCIGDCYYNCTDSLYPDIYDYVDNGASQGVFVDSVVFNCPHPDAALGYMYFTLVLVKYNEPCTWYETGTPKVQYTQNPLLIYPNPAQNSINIGALQELGIVDIYITNINGQIIQHNELCDNYSEIDVSNLNPGIYLLKMINNQGKMIIHKFIKE